LGHLFLAISLVGLGFIGIFHKIADQYKCRPRAISLTVFFWAGLLTLSYLLVTGKADVIQATPVRLYLVALACGFLASIAIVAFQAGLRYGGGKIATSWVVINLSTALPTILSIAVYKEPVSLTKIVGLVLVVVAMLLLWKDKKIDEDAMAAANLATEPEGSE
jgi:drug/metabolite transporter (DMT)-like permease